VTGAVGKTGWEKSGQEMRVDKEGGEARGLIVFLSPEFEVVAAASSLPSPGS